MSQSAVVRVRYKIYSRILYTKCTTAFIPSIFVTWHSSKLHHQPLHQTVTNVAFRYHVTATAWIVCLLSRNEMNWNLECIRLMTAPVSVFVCFCKIDGLYVLKLLPVIVKFSLCTLSDTRNNQWVHSAVNNCLEHPTVHFFFKRKTVPNVRYNATAIHCSDLNWSVPVTFGQSLL
jgi:hypothetical protein